MAASGPAWTRLKSGRDFRTFTAAAAHLGPAWTGNTKKSNAWHDPLLLVLCLGLIRKIAIWSFACQQSPRGCRLQTPASNRTSKFGLCSELIDGPGVCSLYQGM